MHLRTEKSNGITIVFLPGDRLDVSNVREFKREVWPFLEGGAKIVFDMGDLEFVDSSGLGVILSCLRQVNATGGDLRLCGLTKPVRTLFQLVRMHKVFEIFNDREESLEAF